MVIVQINSGNYGSTGNIMLTIAAKARERGHTAFTCCPDGLSMRSCKAENQHFIKGRIARNLHIKLAEITGFNGCFSIIPTLKFISWLDKIKPDIIHMHNLHNCYINLPILFGYIKRRSIRTVWTLHDCWSFTGQCPHFAYIGCDRWKSGCFDCPQYKEYPASLVDKTKTMYRLKKKWFSGVRDLTVVTPSQWLSDLVGMSYLSGYRRRVINNGIDLSVFKPSHSDFRERHNLQDKFVVLGVSFSWGERKGLDVFSRLAAILPDNFAVVLVGTNAEIDSTLPPDVISIHRTQNRAELAEIYTAADVFVNPTKEDTFPTVNMEALACGTPVVTFDTGGSPEIIDETCGIVCERSAEGVYDALKKLLLQPIGSDACTLRAKRYDFDERLAEYAELYEEE
ncbi:MAG: glycosyltransferase [Oscillospiraceae bacterium]|jgi:glycosyltransferase involved in cell wall biosynthesis|nr:glycosyltransferase [Oscillospiraceae bacterium]